MRRRCFVCGKPEGPRYWLASLLLLLCAPLFFLSCCAVRLAVMLNDGHPVKQWFWRREMLGIGRYVYCTFPGWWHRLSCGGSS